MCIIFHAMHDYKLLNYTFFLAFHFNINQLLLGFVDNYVVMLSTLYIHTVINFDNNTLMFVLQHSILPGSKMLNVTSLLIFHVKKVINDLKW